MYKTHQCVIFFFLKQTKPFKCPVIIADETLKVQILQCEQVTFFVLNIALAAI